MPIKFRCKYCNQLMGIARRKAGTDVNCPTCNGLLRVPLQDEPSAPAPAVGSGVVPPPAPVFERSDFGEYLQAEAHNQPALAPPAPRPSPPPAPRPPPLPPPHPPNHTALE